MPLDISLAGTAIPTDPGALKDLRADLNLAFQLDSTFAPWLNQPLDKLPASATKSTISYTSPAASWSPLGSAVIFGLQGGASGSLEVLTAGALLSYTDGLDAPQAAAIAAPDGTAYLKLMLGFNISGNAAAAYSGGAYGVKAAASAAAVYEITFCKAFDPSTKLLNALSQIFQSFVLPLHPATLKNMEAGDYLLYAFDGNLHLSFGAYAGLSQVLYAGQSSADVMQSFGSPLAILSASTRPAITLGATLDFALAYTTRFEALLSKAAGVARLHLFRAASTTSATTLKAGLTFDGNTSASITSHLQAVSDGFVKSAGSAGPATAAALTHILAQSGAVAEVNKYVAEVNDKLTSWLLRTNGMQANLQAALETSSIRTMLAGYDFDLAAPAYDKAWDLAVKGDFVQALKAGSVTLDPRSGLEAAYQRKTSFQCNLFNLWSMSTWDEFQSKTTLIYAGNNVFHLQADIGRTLQTDSMGAMHSLNLYFSASADVSAAGSLSKEDVQLHIDLTAQKDAKAAGAIAALLLAIGGGLACDALGRALRVFAANAPQGTAQLQVTIPASACSAVQADPYDGRKPLTTDTAFDAANWAAFARAADDLNAWPLHPNGAFSAADATRLKAFAGWAELNQAANGDTRPNRVNLGNPYGYWPADFPPFDAGVQALVIYSLLAGQAFMNFCAALEALVQATGSNATGTTWTSLLQLLTTAVKQDLSTDFIRPAALAVVRLCASAAMKVEGPNPAAPTTSHFAVSLNL